ncbi:MAG: 30S ribosomal protein S18, partial [Alphaproteobacteria bacterium]
MEPLPAARGKKPTGKPGQRRQRDDSARTGGKYTPKLLGKAYFQRRRGCPFSGPKAPKIDYKDVRMLGKYLSEHGKILPRHITGVCAEKQRELAQAIKRARML